jgi:hypothetical protein
MIFTSSAGLSISGSMHCYIAQGPVGDELKKSSFSSKGIDATILNKM